MPISSRVLRRASAAALSLALILPGTALASSTVSLSGSTITVTGNTAGDVVAITAGPGGSATRVSDTTGVTSTDCSAVDATTVSCPVTGGRANVSLGAGNDTLTIANDVVGTATISGGAGDDTLHGGNECDTFTADDGADAYTGGSVPDPSFVFGCRDRISYASRTAGVSVTPDGQANDGAAGEGDNVASDISDIDGGSGNDTLVGGPGPNVIDGGAGNDTLTGNGGGDTLRGGAGDDTLSGGAGDDQLYGDLGNDRIDGGDGDDSIQEYGFGEAASGGSAAVPSSNGTDDLVGGAGEDSVWYYRTLDPNNGQPVQQVGVDVSVDDQANDGESGENDNVHSDIEAVNGGDGNDTLTGNDGPNQLSGGAGKDTIDGRGGVDILNGGAGDDTIASRDSGFDRVNCGSNPQSPADADTVTADDVDQLFNCENVLSAPLPPAPAPPAVDKTPATVTLQGLASTLKRKTFASRGLVFRVTTNEAASLVVELRALVRTSGRSIAFSAKAGELILATKSAGQAAGQRKFTLKPSRAYAKAIKNKKLRLSVVVTAKDAAGNVSTATKAVRLG